MFVLALLVGRYRSRRGRSLLERFVAWGAIARCLNPGAGSTSRVGGGLKGGDVDLLHRHHRSEGGLGAGGVRVLRMRFGIGMNTDHTLEEVGQQLSVIGGPPCRGFSLLNKKRDGDARRALWEPFIEIAERSGEGQWWSSRHPSAGRDCDPVGQLRSRLDQGSWAPSDPIGRVREHVARHGDGTGRAACRRPSGLGNPSSRCPAVTPPPRFARSRRPVVSDARSCTPVRGRRRVGAARPVDRRSANGHPARRAASSPRRPRGRSSCSISPV